MQAEQISSQLTQSSTLWRHLFTGKHTSDIVFAGYGFTDSTMSYDDYNGIDVKDKIVMIMTGTPETSDPDDLNSVFRIETERPKIIWALTQGAKAILYVYDPRSKYQRCLCLRSGRYGLFNCRVKGYVAQTI